MPGITYEATARACLERLDEQASTTEEDIKVMAVLLEAFYKYKSRNSERRGIWRRSGLKGQVFGMMAKAERAFGQVMRGENPNPDHFIDSIVYTVFARMLGQEAVGDTDKAINGHWPWEG